MDKYEILTGSAARSSKSHADRESNSTTLRREIPLRWKRVHGQLLLWVAGADRPRDLREIPNLAGPVAGNERQVHAHSRWRGRKFRPDQPSCIERLPVFFRGSPVRDPESARRGVPFP